MCHTRNFASGPDFVARPQTPETWSCVAWRGLLRYEGEKGDVVKLRQNLPRICQGEPGPEARTKKILIDGALSQVRKSNPVDHHAGNGMHLPVPTRTPCDFSATPGAPARSCTTCLRKRAHGSVQPMLRFVINTPARLQLFSLPAGGPSRRVLAGRRHEQLACPPPRRERLGRDVDSESILASVMTFQITSPLTMSHSFCATFCKETSKQSVLPWAQSTPALQCAGSNWIAKIAETDPREAPRELP